MRSEFRTCCMVLIMTTTFMISSCAPFFVRDYPGSMDSNPVRILIAKNAGEIVVSSKGTMKLCRNGKVYEELAAGASRTITRETLGGEMTFVPGTEPILVNGQPYRGSISITIRNESLLAVNTLAIEEYLLSVVPGEIPANWEKESLKAQAVAARTFTYHHLKSPSDRNVIYDLDATAASQVYRGMTDEKPQTTEAVRATSGQVMVYDERPILSYFHSTCGGKTVADRYVWEKSRLPYLQGTKCGYCNDSTKYNWDSTLALAEIRAALLKKYPTLGGIRNISFRKKDDRVVEVLITHSHDTIRINGNTFRLLFPPEKIRSLYFTSKKVNNALVLKGHGWGHGVGLCQWGARGMALKGYNYHEILLHYYTGIKITSIRNGYIASKQKNSFMYQ